MDTCRFESCRGLHHLKGYIMFDVLRKIVARSLENVADVVEAAVVPIISENDPAATKQWADQRESYITFNRDQLNRANAIRQFAQKVYP